MELTEAQRNKLGRYERGNQFASFTLDPDSKTSVVYAWGICGFGERGSRVISNTDLETDVRWLLDEGYVKADEVPLSEGDSKIGQSLLDWAGGVSR